MTPQKEEEEILNGVRLYSDNQSCHDYMSGKSSWIINYFYSINKHSILFIDWIFSSVDNFSSLTTQLYLAVESKINLTACWTFISELNIKSQNS